MYSFRGKFEYSIDEKGRVNIPAKFRKSLNPEADETFVVTRALSGCLRAYPQEIWAKYEADLDAKPDTPDMIRLKRKIRDTLSDSRLDAQGRVTLSTEQIALTKIDKNVVIIGNGKFVEIWSAEQYKTYWGSQTEQEDQAEFDDLFTKSIGIVPPADAGK